MGYKIAYYGTVEKLDDLLVLIYDHKVGELTKALNDGADVNQLFQISKYSKISMIDFSVLVNDVEIAKLLLSYGANVEAWTTELAVWFCDKEMLDLLKEYLLRLKKWKKEFLFNRVHYAGRVENIRNLDNLGISVKKYGGASFRLAILDTKCGRNDEIRRVAAQFVEELLRLNVNIDYHEPDSVFTDGSTPLMVAVRHENNELAKELIKRGADVSICNKYGERAYIVALQKKNKELADYLYEIERHTPFEESEKDALYELYKIPESMRDYLKGDNRIFTCDLGVTSLNTIEFLPYYELIPMKYRRKKYLCISLCTNDYWLFFCWRPDNETMVCLDFECETVTKLGSWDDFIANPIKAITRKCFGIKV